MLNKNELRTIVELEYQNKKISFESGWVAKQANGAVIVRQGDTMVMATVCSVAKDIEQDFFPLTVDYQEKAYAGGKIPGGFLKREGRPAEHEVLVCRLIDRPLRPLFPDGFVQDVQIIVNVLSSDGVNSPDMLAICAASAAVHISDIPFLGPIAAVRVGRVAGKLIANPTLAELEKSDLNYVVAGTKDAIVMVEGGSQFVPEAEIVEALYFGHEEVKKIANLQEQLRGKLGKPKMEYAPKVIDAEFVAKVKGIVGNKLADALVIRGKHERRDAIAATRELVKASLGEEVYAENAKNINTIYEEWTSEIMRARVLDGIRIDGRRLDEVRQIDIETGVIPRAHGSALFTRGETQALVSTTVGTSDDAQRIDSLLFQGEKGFMLHYNFPAFSTGEVKKSGSTGRREVGHGNLAERALKPLLPTKDFPYVIRIVSDIMESNGSSSMASVCGGCLSLMDAGIQIPQHVGGVAMGLVKEGDKVAILTDILGDEDHFGDMDFKVCGSESGITALQMDIKCTGLSRETMEKALAQAREGRLHIIGEMKKALPASREKLNKYAPAIYTIKINPEKIRDVIGKGGVMIRSIIDSTGAKVDVEDSGEVRIASSDVKAAEKAIEIIRGLTEEPEIGRIYNGVVKRIVDFGAFVEILPNIEGLLHISQIADYRVNSVSDELSEGDEVKVKVLDVDRTGKIRLSKKDAS